MRLLHEARKDKMNAKIMNIFQFKIALLKIKPQIWRRIQVPDTFTFWDLHVAIQDAMGWEDYHLHEFSIKNAPPRNKIRVGIPDDEFFPDDELKASWEIPLKQYFSSVKDFCNYWYDFGDDWHHKIVLEKILPYDKNVKYPLCVAGKRACPPEDCGGPWGYVDMMEILRDPIHPDYGNIIEWIGEDFDPEKFDPNKVKFRNSKHRLKLIQKS